MHSEDLRQSCLFWLHLDCVIEWTPLKKIMGLCQNSLVVVYENHKSLSVFRLVFLMLLSSCCVVVLIESSMIKTSLICNKYGSLRWLPLALDLLNQILTNQSLPCGLNLFIYHVILLLKALILRKLSQREVVLVLKLEVRQSTYPQQLYKAIPWLSYKGSLQKVVSFTITG